MVTPTQVDVIIVGSGSAGVCAAVWLARLGVDFVLLEKRDGPLRVGQADGVQCRTVEIFESFGLADELTRDAYWVNEVCFWSGDEKDGIVEIARKRRTPDVQPGMTWQHHVILNQAKLNSILIEDVKKHAGDRIRYGVAVKHVRVDEKKAKMGVQEHAVAVIADCPGEEEVCFEAKYVLGCDGAHSAVRRSLGFKMIGDTLDFVWGVMDVFCRTDFPDLRKKCTIRSPAGNLLIIPREGGSMVRFYVELPHGTVAKAVQLSDIQSTTRRIFAQYALDIVSTHWWSAYSIGQRVADHFTHHDRVFLTGDSCHTHSPKAGQGMNCSLQDGYNLGWKLAAVLRGRAAPELLHTYELERGKAARDLIAFDRELTRLFASAGGSIDEASRVFSDYFVRSGRYTAGLATRYGQSGITNVDGSVQGLAEKALVGMRFPSVQVVRLCDARAIHLAKVLPSDGRWRILVFAGDLMDADSANLLSRLAEFLESPTSPIERLTPVDAPRDSIIETMLIAHGSRVGYEDGGVVIPEVFAPVNGRWGLKDRGKAFIDDESYNYGHGHAYEELGVNVSDCGVVVLRPDTHVAGVFPLDDFGGLAECFKVLTNSDESLGRPG